MLEIASNILDVYQDWIHNSICTNLHEVDEDIKSSHKRCIDGGMDPKYAPALTCFHKEDIFNNSEQLYNFNHSIKQHWELIHNILNIFPHVIQLFNKEGDLLYTDGDINILDIYKERGLDIGVRVAEYCVGTGAPALSLRNCKISKVIGNQHYFRDYNELMCLAAPIVNMQKDIVGVINFSSTMMHEKKFDMFVPYFISFFYSMQIELLLRELVPPKPLIKSFYARDHANLIILNSKGYVISMSLRAQISLGICNREIINRSIYDILEFSTNTFVKTNVKVRKDLCRNKNNDLYYHAEIVPIYNNGKKEIDGYVLALEEMNKSVLIDNSATLVRGDSFERIIGSSEGIIDVIEKAKKTARTNSNVLIEGETGTGKELFAQAIHSSSHRNQGPLVAINCCAIPKELVESELFGYEKGAYTGACTEGNLGKFLQAQNGTIFLDEIDKMDITTQAKLLRVLEERRVTKIGGKTSIPLDIRVISASSENLADEVEKGKFLSALYYRLNVVRLRIPALRDRKEDIPLLVEYYLKEMNKVFCKSITMIDPDAMNHLSQHSWPGNVRQLKNIIEGAFNVCSGTIIRRNDLDLNVNVNNISKSHTNEEKDLEEITKNLFFEALSKHSSAKNAANALGVPVSTFYRKMNKWTQRGDSKPSS